MRYQTIKNKTREYILKIIKQTYFHFSCFLPASIGRIAGGILRLFYSGIAINKEQTDFLKELNAQGHIIYTSKYKSSFEFLFYYSRYHEEGLPFPQIGLDYKIYLWQPISRIFRMIVASIHYMLEKWHVPNPYESGYIRNELLKGQTAFLSLMEPKGIYRRFVKEKTDPVRYLIEIQQDIDEPIYFIPQWILFSKRAHKSQRSLFEIIFGTEENPGRLRRLITLFQKPENVFVEIAEPFNLQEFIRRPENQNRRIDHLTFLVRRELIDRLNRHRQSIVGPILKSRDEIIENIMRYQPLRQFIEEHATSQNMPIQHAYKKAHAYLDEIASNYSHNMIQIFSWAITWISNNMFEGISFNKDNLAKVRQVAQKGPIIFAPCHKSHIDYLVMSYVLYHNNLPCPLIAAGKNLSFWPMGPIFRGGGAFFLRRTFRGALLYSRVFSEYVEMVLKEGFNIEFFIEGGRSRTGKLNLAKTGLLSIILDAYRNGACSNINFVPIFIGYDRIIEEKSYLSEMEGQKKEPESLSQLIKARKFLTKRFGRIYVQFNDPISLKDVLSQFDTSFHDMTDQERKIVCRNIGHRLINSINEVTVVTPHTLVACALLNCPTKGFMKSEFASLVETYLNYLISQNAKLSDTLSNYVQAFEEALQNYMDSKIVEKMAVSSVREALGDIKLRVIEHKRPYLDYYKNNCICWFIPAAYTALSIISKDAFQFTLEELSHSYEFLQEFFKNEFAYDVEKTSFDYVNTTIQSFLEDAIIIPHVDLPDTYNVTSAGLRKLESFAAFLRPYFEAYRIALNVFMENDRDALDENEVAKKVQQEGAKMYKRMEVELKETLSKITFKNAVNYFQYHNIKGREDSEKIEAYNIKINNYMKSLNLL